METVCLALERDNNLFAVGSQSHVSFYDPRSGTAVGYIGSRDPGAGEPRRGVKETLSLEGVLETCLSLQAAYSKQSSLEALINITALACLLLCSFVVYLAQTL